MKYKIVHRSDLTFAAMVWGNERNVRAVILDGTVRRWVGIGWVDEGKPTLRQKRTLRVVVD